MSEQWTCVYCGHPNPYNARYCISCNARIPDLWQKFIQERAKTEESEQPDSSAPGGEPEPTPEEIVVPRPGDMVGDLFKLADAALSGDIPPADFADFITEVSANLQAAFETLFSQLADIPVDVPDYSEHLKSLLVDVQFMFNKGLEEFFHFSETKDPAHIHFGKVLAQRAELEYIQILEMLRIDATANPFTGETDVVGKLASSLVSGELNQEDFKESLAELEKELLEYIEKGEKSLKVGLEKARQFDGTNMEIMDEAMSELQEAEEQLSKAIINLYSPEEIRRAVEEIVENTVEEMNLKIIEKEEEETESSG